MSEIGHSVRLLVSLSDRCSYPNLKAKTGPDHTTALIQAQHSGVASPEGIQKQMEGQGRMRDRRKMVELKLKRVRGACNVAMRLKKRLHKGR